VTYHCSELNVVIYFTPGHYVVVVILKTCIERRLSCRRNTTRYFVTGYFAKSLEVIENSTIQKFGYGSSRI